MHLKNVCQECIIHSGGCCTKVNFCIHKSEANSFLEYISKNGLPSDHKFERFGENSDLFLYNSGEDHCIFLDENQRCKIYADRPLICRVFPILWTDPNNFFIDLSCPFAYTIPLKDILISLDDPKNIEQIELMKKLDFKSSQKRYLPVNGLIDHFPALEIVRDKEIGI